jgi:hypothetical protein
MKAAASVFPAFIGTICGVCIFVGYLPIWLGVGLVMSGVVSATLGGVLVNRNPLVAAYLICFWILCGIGLLAYAAALLLWLALHIQVLFPGLNASTEKEVVSAVTGAVTTFLGVILIKDFESGTGYFWPGALFKKLVQKKFSTGRLAPRPDTKEWDTVFADRVRDNGPRGWGCRACLARAKILKRHVDSV